MRILLDAQLPRRLARELSNRGIDALHTLDLPDGNRTADRRISKFADRESRWVATKDRDFVDGFLLRGTPRRLLLVSTGNIDNDSLVALFIDRLAEIEGASETNRFIELSRSMLVIRE